MSAHYYEAQANEFPIQTKTALGFTKVQFSPDASRRLFGASTWDGFVKIFDLTNLGAPIDVRTVSHKKSVLAFTFTTSGQIVSGGLDEIVKLCDIETGRETIMGQHTGVRCLEFSPTMRTPVSGGWDSNIKLWDIRTLTPVGTMNCEEKIYAMDVIDNRCVVGTKDKQIFIWDVRNLKAPMQKRESPLKFQIRAIKNFPSGEAFVVSSIEGRVAVEYFDTNPEIQKSKYAFKCHRIKDETGELVYPVNAIAFHPIHRTFATGGSDSMVNLWDPFGRKRLCQFRKFPSSVTSLSFSPDGAYLGISTTFLYEDDQSSDPFNVTDLMSLTIRKVSELEVRPK
ncbi:Mitotic checkpoint protein BUB3 [Aphelenchoides bicaudatus]|nr:Mitotic checkpoint protein BUB3 [Aphelenchoides bicaudatus]